ncbi:ATP-binding protein [Candidatus Woesearchaeota archaeon]|nr:ATP-binding protein [Candidatus Woesearchaeota archaeon]
MISKEKWAELIRDFHGKAMPEMIPRAREIDVESGLQRAISIIGPRRAGKTFEMFFLIAKIRQKHGTERALYINFERVDLQGAAGKDLGVMLETYYELYPQNKGKRVWLFLDEVQNVPGWERFVRSSLDEGISVIISGSSAKLLSREVATSMRGRNLSYQMYPFSFGEFLIARRFEVKKMYSSHEKALLIHFFQEFLVSGGYPEAIIYGKEREKITRDIFDTALYRDVIERGKIRNTGVMRELIKALLNSAEFSMHKFYNYCKSRGMKTSKNALYKYAEYLNDAFFVFFLRKHSQSYKKSGQSLPKVYFVDNGLLTVNGIDDKGRLLENLVFVELTRRNKEIAYYQNALKEEVDFVVKKGKKVTQLIQVCYDASSYLTLERETRALGKASEEFACRDLVLITMREEREEKVNGLTIRVIPAWKWMLA